MADIVRSCRVLYVRYRRLKGKLKREYMKSWRVDRWDGWRDVYI